MSFHQLQQRQSLGSVMGESELSARLRLSNAQLRRLLALCDNSLGEAQRATRELSDRVTLLREEIESLLGDGRRAG